MEPQGPGPNLDKILSAFDAVVESCWVAHDPGSGSAVESDKTTRLLEVKARENLRC